MKFYRSFFFIIFITFSNLHSQSIKSETVKTLCSCTPLYFEQIGNQLVYFKNNDSKNNRNAFRIYILERISNSWHEMNSILIDQEEFYFFDKTEINTKYIDGKNYLFITIEAAYMGTAYHGLTINRFIFYDIANNSFDSFSYHKWGSETIGNYVFEDAKNEKKFLQTTTQYIENFYKIEDIDIEKRPYLKWKIENSNLYQDAEYYKDRAVELSVVFVEIDISVNELDKELREWRETTFRENENYRTYAGFASPIFLYSKKNKKSYILWIPQGLGAGCCWGWRSFSLKKLEGHILIAESNFLKLYFDLQKSTVVSSTP